MLNLFESDDAAGPAEGLRVVTVLDRGVREADSLVQDPELQSELRSTLGGLYHKLGHLDRAEPLLLAAWTAQTSTLGPDHPQTMRTQLRSRRSVPINRTSRWPNDSEPDGRFEP